MQWRKQTLYRENQRITAFSHDTVKTSKVLSCFCYSCVFFILIHIFSVSFDLLLFFFSFYFFYFPKSVEFRLYEKCCVHVPVPFSHAPCFSHDVHWCVFVFVSLPSCCESLSLSVSLSPKRALLCLSVTPSLRVFFTSLVRISDLSRCQLCTSTLPKHCRHRRSLYCRGSADTTVLYGNKAMQHPGQVVPLVDVCLIFNQGRITSSLIQFLFVCFVRLFGLKSQISYGMPHLRSQHLMTFFINH